MVMEKQIAFLMDAENMGNTSWTQLANAIHR